MKNFLIDNKYDYMNNSFFLLFNLLQLRKSFSKSHLNLYLYWVKNVQKNCNEWMLIYPKIFGSNYLSLNVFDFPQDNFHQNNR